MTNEPALPSRSPDSKPDVDNLTPGEPAWRVALLFPPQGSWSEAEYLELDAGRLIEFSNGCVEVLDMPTKAHQRLVRFLFQCLHTFVSSAGLGEVFFAPLPVRLWAEKFREPDVVFVRRGRGDYRGFPDGADLVIEVLSEGDANRRRDLEVKRAEYFQAGIGEYWIVDPEAESVIVLHRGPSAYEHHGVFRRGDVASSATLAGFSVSVGNLFDSATGDQ